MKFLKVPVLALCFAAWSLVLAYGIGTMLKVKPPSSNFETIPSTSQHLSRSAGPDETWVGGNIVSPNVVPDGRLEFTVLEETQSISITCYPPGANCMEFPHVYIDEDNGTWRVWGKFQGGRK